MLYYTRIEVIFMPENIEKIINDFLENVKSIFKEKLKKVILCGSYARGDYNENSDINILILVDLSNREMLKYNDKIWEKCGDIAREQNIIISPLVRSIKSFLLNQDTKQNFIDAINEGKVLFEAENIEIFDHFLD
jgi:predicted nucleotidyltransferase